MKATALLLMMAATLCFAGIDDFYSFNATTTTYTPITGTQIGTILSDADKKAFLEAAKVAVEANRARVDKDDANGVAKLRELGMQVVDNVDKSKFQATLAPVMAQFEKEFGKANLDKIRNVQ